VYKELERGRAPSVHLDRKARSLQANTDTSQVVDAKGVCSSTDCTPIQNLRNLSITRDGQLYAATSVSPPPLFPTPLIRMAYFMFRFTLCVPH